jgi:hypothetical protein
MKVAHSSNSILIDVLLYVVVQVPLSLERGRFPLLEINRLLLAAKAIGDRLVRLLDDYRGFQCEMD